MGVVVFTVSDDAQGMPMTHDLAAGSVSTGLTATTIQHDGGDLDLRPGQVIELHASANTRVNFNGNEASQDSGHFIPAGRQRRYRALEAGSVSVIDVLGL